MKYYYVNSLEKILEPAKGRKIILYGIEPFSRVIYHNLTHMGKEVSYFVDEEGREESLFEKEVRNPLELLYENKDEIYVICFTMKNHGQVYNKLLQYGLEFEKNFSIYGLGGYIQKFNAIDSLLGFTRIYDNGLNFQVYGNPQDEKAIRIMTLGGSTSDPTMGNVKTWPEQLYEELRKEHQVVVYSGGMGGYSTHQELLKFMRDGLPLHPDIVISFDGYNDIGYQVSVEEHPYLHRYQKKFYDFIETHTPMAPDTLDMRAVNQIAHGMENANRTDYENWFEAVRSLHALAKEHGIQYFSFLQPVQGVGTPVLDDSILELKKIYSSAYEREASLLQRTVNFVNGCRKFIEKNDYMTDLTDIFDGEADVYYDICHSTEKGHQIIAKNILKKITSTLEEY